MTTRVDEPFQETLGPPGRILQSPVLRRVAPHLFTTRDVTFRGPDAPGDETKLAAAFHLAAGDIVYVRQVHGRGVCVVQPGVAVPPTDADAIVSTDPARAIAVRVADCVPILLADRGGRAVAAVHAGWRGTCAGVAMATVETLRQLGVPPGDLVAAVGPSIGPCCYDVDDRVRSTFLDPGASPLEPPHAHLLGASPPRSAGVPAAPARWGGFRVARALTARSHARRGDPTAWFTEAGPGRWRLDLWRANHEQLVAAGVPAADIHHARLCTKDRPDLCFSYRREGPGTGRLVAAIRLDGWSRPARVAAPRHSP